MARFYDTDILEDSQGSLKVVEVRAGYTKVYFLPSKGALKEARIDDNGKTLILEIDAQKDSVCTHPIIGWPDRTDFLQPKYDFLETITLHGFDYGGVKTDDDILKILANFPDYVYKRYDLGLGLHKKCNILVDTLEDWNIKHLVISRIKEASIDEKRSTLILNHEEFEKIYKNTELITGRARRVARRLKNIDTNNILSNLLGNPEKYPMQPYPKFRIEPIARLIAEETSAIDIPQEQAEARDIALENIKKIMAQQPEKNIKLRNDIELVSLEDLIKRYELMLDKGASETAWQALFQHNPFILSMVFSSPINIIQGQASVGGMGIDGSGNTITDFLVANSISNNATVIEIKTPDKELLKETTSYRKDLYNVANDLSGGVNQVLDQRMEFQQDINRLKVKFKGKGVWFESYYTTGVLIIGTMPSDEDKQKSFELFRRNSKDVVIITFDELLEKIKQLLGFLKENTDDTIKK